MLGTNPKDLLGIKKAPINLVPAVGIIYEAMAMGNGEEKYGPYNWRKNKVLASIYVAALFRHVMAWYDQQEELAQDSGVHHLAHAKANLGIMIDAMETGNLVDDRPRGGRAATLLSQNKNENKLSVLRAPAVGVGQNPRRKKRPTPGA